MKNEFPRIYLKNACHRPLDVIVYCLAVKMSPGPGKRYGFFKVETGTAVVDFTQTFACDGRAMQKHVKRIISEVLFFRVPRLRSSERSLGRR